LAQGGCGGFEALRLHMCVWQQLRELPRTLPASLVTATRLQEL